MRKLVVEPVVVRRVAWAGSRLRSLVQENWVASVVPAVGEGADRSAELDAVEGAAADCLAGDDAKEHLDQVPPSFSGGGFRVAEMIAASSTVFGRPGCGSSCNPPIPGLANRSRDLITVGRGAPPSAAPQLSYPHRRPLRARSWPAPHTQQTSSRTASTTPASADPHPSGSGWVRIPPMGRAECGAENQGPSVTTSNTLPKPRNQVDELTRVRAGSARRWSVRSSAVLTAGDRHAHLVNQDQGEG